MRPDRGRVVETDCALEEMRRHLAGVVAAELLRSVVHKRKGRDNLPRPSTTVRLRPDATCYFGWPGAEPPRNRRDPSGRTKLRPTALFEPSLARYPSMVSVVPIFTVFLVTPVRIS